jgi:fatty acid desaturase
VNAVSRAFFLNYHYHLAHHRHPTTPWLHLRDFVEPGEPQPSFLGVWLSMWRGPRRLETVPDER